MNSSENEPLPTSFQAGRPMPGRAPSDEEDSVDVRSLSQLDRFLEAIKAHERWGLAVGVGVQMLVLAAMIVLGTLKALDGGIFP